MGDPFLFERAPGQQGSRYVWTRKVRAKTVTVALSHEQYFWLRKAVANQRKLEEIVQQMQTLSRQVLFETLCPESSAANALERKF